MQVSATGGCTPLARGQLAAAENGLSCHAEEGPIVRRTCLLRTPPKKSGVRKMDDHEKIEKTCAVERSLRTNTNDMVKDTSCYDLLVRTPSITYFAPPTACSHPTHLATRRAYHLRPAQARSRRPTTRARESATPTSMLETRRRPRSSSGSAKPTRRCLTTTAVPPTTVTAKLVSKAAPGSTLATSTRRLSEGPSSSRGSAC